MYFAVARQGPTYGNHELPYCFNYEALRDLHLHPGMKVTYITDMRRARRLKHAFPRCIPVGSVILGKFVGAGKRQRQRGVTELGAVSVREAKHTMCIRLLSYLGTQDLHGPGHF